MSKLILSSLPKTWLIDVDGTIVKHNGHLEMAGDKLLPGAKEFLQEIPQNDIIIFLTARKSNQIQALRNFLTQNVIRFNIILSDLPHGERIIINDNKPSGMYTAYAINKPRDSDWDINLTIDPSI